MADEKILKEQEKAVQGTESEAEKESEEFQVSETWAQDIIEDLDDYIESMGHYLRQ